jgi:UDP-N-acetylglucosamine--N-acetylmuramyl-(pentapeptide) pyrophosphoryl-undecaprenol N-acetylglucosamine transferase
LAKIVVAAGASGGHVYPGLATAEVLRDRGHDVLFIGGDRLESRIVPEAGFEFEALPVKRPPSVRVELLTPRGLSSLGSIAWAIRRARNLLRSVDPDAVLGMGGFAALPVSIAAGTKRLPLVLHEQNANLSLAQRVPLRWARVIALGLPLTEQLKVRTIEVGNPVRGGIAALTEIVGEQRNEARRVSRARLQLDTDRPTLLVLGGSLGSGPLNETLPSLDIDHQIQTFHIAGPDREGPVKDAYAKKGRSARVVGYLDNIEDAYMTADVAVSRSGASVVAELALAGLPSVLVPLPTLTRGDQEANARTLERAGGASVILQSDPDFTDKLRVRIEELFADAKQRESMSAAVRTRARPDAAQRLAEVVESVI